MSTCLYCGEENVSHKHFENCRELLKMDGVMEKINEGDVRQIVMKEISAEIENLEEKDEPMSEDVLRLCADLQDECGELMTTTLDAIANKIDSSNIPAKLLKLTAKCARTMMVFEKQLQDKWD